jgi:hypothetical protein
MKMRTRLLKTRSILTILFFLTFISILFLIYSFPREVESDLRGNVGRAALQELSAKGKPVVPNQLDLNLKPAVPLVQPELPQTGNDRPQPKTSTSKEPLKITTTLSQAASTQSSTTKGPPLGDNNKKAAEPAKGLHLPSQIFRAKTHPILRYPASLPVESDLLQELSRSRLVLQELLEKANKTETDIHNMKPSFDENSGACHCERISDPCKCCLQIAMKQVKFEHIACVNFTYLPSKQALRLIVALYDRVLLGDATARLASLLKEDASSVKKLSDIGLSEKSNANVSTSTKGTVIVAAPVAKEATADPEVLLLAEDPPLVCIGDTWSLCTRFYLVTYEVIPTATHKTRLRGCLDITIQFQHQVIQFYHAGCFTAQSKENEKDPLPPLFHVPGLT